MSRTFHLLALLALLGACQTPPGKGPAPATNTDCQPHDLRIQLGQTSDGKLARQAMAISRCNGRTFSDSRGRRWTTDAQGRVIIPRPLDQTWITWPDEPTRFIDMALAFWLFEQGHHFLAVRQMISNMLHPGIAPQMKPHFCSWWERARSEGGTWEKMMSALPLAGYRTEKHLVAASPRHGFLLRLPPRFEVESKALDGDTTLYVLTAPGGKKNLFLLLVSAKPVIAVNELLELPAGTRWTTGRDGTGTAEIQGNAWVRRDEKIFGQTHVWLASGSMRSRIQDLPAMMESFSMVDPCPATEAPQPVEP
ncbi:hypothetical protein KKD52_06955 [Myxococcota bacterium]|nr:hypothetical protein [Myxococcota bacterium]MBU1411373.1 hypothetical protein [Myxococcota bacterium]MBU1510084.1 hypothetical protein [Myxococcota bacterium]